MTDFTQFERAEDAIPLCEPDITEAEKQAVLEVLSRRWLAYGPECLAFEEEFCRLTGAEHALALNSFTSALQIALRVHNIGPGDEVILPSLVSTATAHTILHTGATTVFAEIDPKTCCLDPIHAESLITPQTRAVIAVHYAGHPASLDVLRRMASENGLALIEDASHALGASDQGTPIGGGSSIVCFSLGIGSNLSTGEGGMLTLPTRELRERALRLSGDGSAEQDLDGWRNEVLEFGFSCRATDLAAALGRAQLARLPDMQKRRGKAWEFYNEMFGDDGRLILPPESPDTTHARCLYVLRLSEESNARRDEVVSALREKGIGASAHCHPVHLHPAYRQRFGFREGMLPASEAAAACLFSLPMHSRLTEQQVNRISIEVLRLV
jgi:dTDP-4-amino-4,6-dideoxygalactose transaminase